MIETQPDSSSQDGAAGDSSVSRREAVPGARSFRRFTVLLLAGAVLMAPCFWGALAFTAAPRAAGRAFINALREGDYDAAFAMCSADLQRHLGSAEELGRQTRREALPERWWWTSSKRQGDEAQLSSTSRSWWGDASVSMTLHRDGDEWRVVRMSAGTDGGRMELAVPVR